MNEKPVSFTFDKKIIPLVALGCLCAGIVIGYKLAGGPTKIELEKPETIYSNYPAETVTVSTTPATETAEETETNELG